MEAKPLVHIAASLVNVAVIKLFTLAGWITWISTAPDLTGAGHHDESNVGTYHNSNTQ